MIYKIKKFNQKKFDFLKTLDDFLKKKKLKNLKHVIETSKKNSHELEKIFYDFFVTEEFKNVYKSFIHNEIRKNVKKNFVYQKVPSVRIVFPNENSVNFHNDQWYGHGNNIKNIWVPFTDCKKTKCLCFLNNKDNKRVLSMIKEKITIKQINLFCKKRVEYAECKYGEYLSFPTTAIHGTTTNLSNEIRISFDFRICFDNNYGFKNKDFFLELKNNRENKNKKKKKLDSCGYINQNKVFNKISISQTIQQEAISSYCGKNNLNLKKLETELIGFKQKYLTLDHILSENKKDTPKIILIFSDMILRDKNIYNCIMKGKKKGFKFHYINEGY